MAQAGPSRKSRISMSDLLGQYRRGLARLRHPARSAVECPAHLLLWASEPHHLFGLIYYKPYGISFTLFLTVRNDAICIF